MTEMEQFAMNFENGARIIERAGRYKGLRGTLNTKFDDEGYFEISWDDGESETVSIGDFNYAVNTGQLEYVRNYNEQISS